MNSRQDPLIAVWAPHGETEDGIVPSLKQAGHSVLAVSTVEKFFTLRDSGQSFKLLVFAAAEDSKLHSLTSIARALDLPALVLVTDGQWKAIRYGYSFSKSDAMRFPSGGPDFDWIEELAWRIDTLLLRAAVSAPQEDVRQDLVCGTIRFTFYPKQAVFLENKEVHLQPRQFEVALQLFLNSGDVVPRGLLLRAYWGDKTGNAKSKSLDVCIARIRKILDLHPRNGFFLRAVYGRGYVLRQVRRQADG